MAASAMESSQLPGSQRALPSGFEYINDIMNMPSSRLKAGALVNVIGFVMDYQPPIRSRGTDFKCTVEIKDKSTECSSSGIKVNIFLPEDKMPRFSGTVGDVLLVRKAKVQMWAGFVSLVSNWGTEFHVIPASRIPQSISEIPANLWASTPQKARRPTISETEYVIWANKFKDSLFLPSSDEFEDRAVKAMNIKQKFSLLKDVKNESFHDVLGEVIKVFQGSGEAITVYLSDYTGNSLFYNYSWLGIDGAVARDGDEYGYTKARSKTPKDWPGPYGKLTIQLTLFDPHATFVRESVKVGQWVFLKNVQFKLGRNGCLKGYLREDRKAFEGKIQVEVMQRRDDEEGDEVSENYLRWKDGIRRKYEWEERFKKQKRELVEEASGGFKEKRKQADGVMNSKRRRTERRAAASAKVADAANRAKELDLNENVRCSHSEIPVSTLEEILTPQMLPSTSDADQVRIAPFSNAKYRANVRVVDYFPESIEDFAVSHRASDYDMLSDYSGGEESDRDDDLRNFRNGHGFRERVWEWRFALQVEDAMDKKLDGDKESQKMWLLVDNHAAQMLLRLEEDAANLRSNPELLSNLKNQLWQLWGNLEEHKSALLQQKESTKSNEPRPPTQVPQSSLASIDSSPPSRNPGAQPDLNSSDAEQDLSPVRPKSTVLVERDVNIENRSSRKDGADEGGSAKQKRLTGEQQHQDATSSEDKGPAVRNKAFTCCIQQYGIQMAEEDPRKADAGPGKRWERRFGIFGTTIL